LRRCQTEGVFGAVRPPRAEEAGSVFVKPGVAHGNRSGWPAPQTAYDESGRSKRVFARLIAAGDRAAVEERLAKEIRFDPDVWIVEIEDGRPALSRSGASLMSGRFASPLPAGERSGRIVRCDPVGDSPRVRVR